MGNTFDSKGFWIGSTLQDPKSKVTQVILVPFSSMLSVSNNEMQTYLLTINCEKSMIGKKIDFNFINKERIRMKFSQQDSFVVLSRGEIFEKAFSNIKMSSLLDKHGYIQICIPIKSVETFFENLCDILKSDQYYIYNEEFDYFLNQFSHLKKYSFYKKNIPTMISPFLVKLEPGIKKAERSLLNAKIHIDQSTFEEPGKLKNIRFTSGIACCRIAKSTNPNLPFLSNPTAMRNLLTTFESVSICHPLFFLDESDQWLRDILKNCPNISGLIFRGKFYAVYTSPFLFDFIQHSSLKKLTFSWRIYLENEFEDESDWDLFDRMLLALDQDITMAKDFFAKKSTKIDCDFIKFVSSIAEKNISVEQLSLRHFPLGDEGLIKILEALKNNKASKLSCLDLGDCDLSEKGIKALFGYTSNTVCPLSRGFLDDNHIPMYRIIDLLRSYKGESFSFQGMIASLSSHFINEKRALDFPSMCTISHVASSTVSSSSMVSSFTSEIASSNETSSFDSVNFSEQLVYTPLLGGKMRSNYGSLERKQNEESSTSDNDKNFQFTKKKDKCGS